MKVITNEERLKQLENFLLALQDKYKKKADKEPNYLIKKIYEDLAYDAGNVDGVPNNITSW